MFHPVDRFKTCRVKHCTVLCQRSIYILSYSGSFLIFLWEQPGAAFWIHDHFSNTSIPGVSAGLVLCVFTMCVCVYMYMCMFMNLSDFVHKCVCLHACVCHSTLDRLLQTHWLTWGGEGAPLLSHSSRRRYSWGRGVTELHHHTQRRRRTTSTREKRHWNMDNLYRQYKRPTKAQKRKVNRKRMRRAGG